MLKKFLYDGILDTMREHARRRGIPIKTYETRINRYGNRPENYDKILYVGRLGPSFVTFRGERHTVTTWARKYGMDPETVFTHLRRGATLSQALRLWHKRKPTTMRTRGNHTRRKLAALGIFA